MEYYSIFLVLLPITLIFLFCSLKSKQPKLPPPPGPKPWPIIGHIHLLGKQPHRAVTDLSKTYGPIMSLKLGSITTIVISSPNIAKEMFLKHDLAFSSRQIPDASRATNHDKHSMVWLPVGPKWRYLRKISAIQLFSNQQLDASQVIRLKKVDELVEFSGSCCEKNQPVDIGKAAFITSLNLLSNTFFSIDLCSFDVSKSQEFKDLSWEFMEVLAMPNVSDFFPLLRGLDLQGINKRLKGCYLKMLNIFDDIIVERLQDLTASKNDVLDTLLKLVDEQELSRDDVKHLLVDLFVAGTDTTSNTLEWAMTEILCHPNILEKAQIEIHQVRGKNKVQESDISKLPYIQAIVKETLRLHPPSSFLIPHKTIEDVHLCNYSIPKNAQVWVNIWSIGRDRSVWENPELFVPERFVNNDIDMKGQDFELIPFGAGRRICPGMPLAYRIVHLMLASILHSFNWTLPIGMKPKDVNMEEKFGITLPKVQPLHAIPHFK